jgi:hypothetical protein
MPTRYSFNGYLYAVFHGQVSAPVIAYCWYTCTDCVHAVLANTAALLLAKNTESTTLHKLAYSACCVRTVTLAAVAVLTRCCLYSTQLSCTEI